MSTTIIMISGYARSGKDTLANALTEYSRTESARVSFATPLKRAVQIALNELGLGHIDAFTEDPALKALLRPLFVEVGKAARAIDKDVFVKAAWRDVCDLAYQGKELIVVPDLRYSNEIELFRRWGEVNEYTVKHVHIRRSGNKAANQEEFESVHFLPLADDSCEFREGAISDIAEWADKYVSDLWAKGIFKNKKLAVAFDEKASVFTDGHHHVMPAEQRASISASPGMPINKAKVSGYCEPKGGTFIWGNKTFVDPVAFEGELKALDARLDKLSQRVDTDRANLEGHEQDIGKLEERIKKLEQQVANQNQALNRVANVFDTYLSRNAYYHVLQALEGNANA
jgi:hypothetical protein